MNEMRKLINLMESIQRLDEAAPELKKLGIPDNMIHSIMKTFSLKHDDIEIEPFPQRPTVAATKNNIVIRKTRSGEWYVVANEWLDSTSWVVIDNNGKRRHGKSFSAVKPYFGKGASEYWKIKGDARTRNYWGLEREKSGDPLENKFRDEEEIYAYFNRTFLPRIKPKADAIINRIYDNIRNLKGDVDYAYRSNAGGYTSTSHHTRDGRERAIDLVQSIERLMDEGFSAETLGRYMKAQTGYSLPQNFRNAAQLNYIMDDSKLGRQKVAKVILGQLRTLEKEFEDALEQTTGQQDNK